MSQRAGSVSYLTFAAGFSLAVYALFVLACDRGRLRRVSSPPWAATPWPPTSFTTWSATPSSPMCRMTAPLWFVAAAFGLYLAVTYLFVRYLEKNRIFLRL